MPRAYSYIRFSTPEQSKGDSYRRQLEKSRAYAEAHSLVLDDSLAFHDEGVSAFRGKNVQTGALGEFIAAVDSGRVPPGSYLLVESLDRLSRDKALAALEQFSSILRRGVVIVTLMDGKTFTAESLADHPNDLIMSLLVMTRAHEESATKSKRLRSTWTQKRRLAAEGGRPLTGVCPAWLKLKKAESKFEIVEDRAKTVRRIYKMSLDGLGKSVIAKRLNSEGLPNFGRGKGWYSSYVYKLLTNPAVYGEFQPHKVIDVEGKRRRKPDGDPIEGYYPPIISKADFLKVQTMLRKRATPSGPRGKRLSNLFTGLAYCGSCGATMHMKNKGKPPRGGKYLVCSNSERGIGGCKYHSWRYTVTEASLIISIREINWPELLPVVAKSINASLSHLEGQLLTVEDEQAQAIRKREAIIDFLVERPESLGFLERPR